MSNTSVPSAFQSKYNPINGKNLVPLHALPPFSKCKVQQLPTKSDFDQICKIKSIMHSNTNTTIVLLQNLLSSGYSIGKIYHCYDKDTKTMKQKLNKCWKEYQIIKHCGLSEYFGIYYDAQYQSLIIHQQAYTHTLHQYISLRQQQQQQQQRISELECKTITKQILLSLWRLHNCHYVHMDIKPDNIMHRELDHLYSSTHLQDGWLLIDFNEIKKNKSNGCYIGTMGWSAPEIEYNGTKNVYNYSADIFAFGLIILYCLFGKQPLQIPESERCKYRIHTDDDSKEILRKRVLRKQILTNWYYGTVKDSEEMMKEYLLTLYKDSKISSDLYLLLKDGILVYDPKKRFDCKKIYNSKWFKN